MCTFFIKVNAQNVDFQNDIYHRYIDGRVQDTASNSNETIDNIIYLAKKGKLQLYTIDVGLDSISGSGTVSTYLQKSYDKGDTYKNIDTIDFFMTTSDTTIQFQDVNTGTDATRLRIRTVGAASTKVKRDYVSIRMIDKY